jgi:hypothetical protein
MRAGLSTALIFAAALVAAPAAMANANTTKSTNWAGYAIHRSGVSFRQVSGTWTQPSATCVAGQQSYSAAWVGLGGYQPTSGALEQIGTELDCNAAGKVVSSAWYELVPAPSTTISLAVQPGDVMHATVTVAGHRVVFDLEDLTRHRTFHKTSYAPSIDVSSAEWIVEAPSECVSQFACQTLPLADFGSVTFASATATSVGGTAGSILNSAWSRTKIRLTPGAQRFIVARSTSDSAITAAPSPLRRGGTQFDVTYATASVQGTQSLSPRQSRLRAAYLEH